MLDIYQIDAFSQKLFGGNPAAVIPLEASMEPALMQAIAAENNLSETVFFWPAQNEQRGFDIRWFTPTAEVDLCGHATLAAAYVLFEELAWPEQSILFHGRVAGQLEVSRDAGWISLDFPSGAAELTAAPEALLSALGLKQEDVVESALGRDWLIRLASSEQVLAVAPNFHELAGCHDYGVIVTAAADTESGQEDFVSRFFIPSRGIDEDPVTGSAHCALVPFWAERLGKTELLAKQVSQRGGELRCHLDAGRVHMAGQAVMYMRGQLASV